MLKINTTFSKDTPDILASLRALLARFAKNNYRGELLFFSLLSSLKAQDSYKRDPQELIEFSIINLKPLFWFASKKGCWGKVQDP